MGENQHAHGIHGIYAEATEEAWHFGDQPKEEKSAFSTVSLAEVGRQREEFLEMHFKLDEANGRVSELKEEKEALQVELNELKYHGYRPMPSIHHDPDPLDDWGRPGGH